MSAPSAGPLAGPSWAGARIALDGLPLQVRSAGIAAYTRALVGAMARLRPQARFLLFGLSDLARAALRAVPPDPPAAPLPDNVAWCRSLLYPAITGFPLPLPRLLPLRAATGAVALFHATNYVTPRAAGVPLVVTVHDLTLLRHPELGTPALRRLVGRTARSVREATRVIADSEATRRDVVELLGAPPDRVRVVPLGCDPRFRPGDMAAARRAVAAELGIDAPFVLHVGTIEPRKNLPALLSAFARARRTRGLRQLLVLAGAPGWGVEPVRARIAAEGLADVVRLTGPVSDAQLLQLYRAADLFAFPSLYEGFGLPVVEALACGTPVVTANAAALPEVAGDAALLVDPRDEGALADALDRGVNDPELRARLRTAGPARAAQFTWERCAAATLAVYEESAPSLRA
jgi:glycosyltransferase involved in cell wall biosynthesis